MDGERKSHISLTHTREQRAKMASALTKTITSITIQRIAVTEKYRPIYEKQAKENSLNNLKQNQSTDKSNLTTRKENNSTVNKLSSIAGVKPTTYRMGAKVLNSDNVLSGKTSISARYKEFII